MYVNNNANAQVQSAGQQAQAANGAGAANGNINVVGQSHQNPSTLRRIGRGISRIFGFSRIRRWLSGRSYTNYNANGQRHRSSDRTPLLPDSSARSQAMHGMAHAYDQPSTSRAAQASAGALASSARSTPKAAQLRDDIALCDLKIKQYSAKVQNTGQEKTKLQAQLDLAKQTNAATQDIEMQLVKVEDMRLAACKALMGVQAKKNTLVRQLELQTVSHSSASSSRPVFSKPKSGAVDVNEKEMLRTRLQVLSQEVANCVSTMNDLDGAIKIAKAVVTPLFEQLEELKDSTMSTYAEVAEAGRAYGDAVARLNDLDKQWQQAKKAREDAVECYQDVFVLWCCTN